MGEVGAVAVGRDGEMQEGIWLRADPFRHFLKFDAVVAQQRLALHVHLQLVPRGEEILARRPPREVGRQKRRVIVAQFLAEPGKPLRRISAHQAKRCDQGDAAFGKTTDDDHRAGAATLAHVALPGRKPVESLEGGAVRGALKPPPFGLDRCKFSENLDGEPRPQVAHALARRRGHARADADWRGRALKCRQCRGACHSIH
jgi:hypothetical protein